MKKSLQCQNSLASWIISKRRFDDRGQQSSQIKQKTWSEIDLSTHQTVVMSLVLWFLNKLFFDFSFHIHVHTKFIYFECKTYSQVIYAIEDFFERFGNILHN